MDVLDRADAFIRNYEERKQKLTYLESSIEYLIQTLKGYPTQLELLEKVRVFMQTLAEETRNEIMSGLEEIVTLCLQNVFGPHLTFEIEVETKRNNTGVEFYVVNTDGDHIVRLKPEDNMGGGVIDTISIGLRFGLLKVMKPLPQGPIFLDEPAKMVSADRIDSIANLLKELSIIFNRQINMVTHHESLLEVVDNAIYVKNEGGRTICVQ